MTNTQTTTTHKANHYFGMLVALAVLAMMLAARPSCAADTFTVEFFSNPSGTGEGKKFIGKTTVTTDASGLASFTFTPSAKVAAGQTITATAINTTTHDTSEFSLPRTAASV